ncbi:MAG1140 family protein [Mycoplasmopsis felifaucium]|uniref:Mce/MlaD domain-containing protein n=1 Tax=Mycoplasmopsis felifaucium TaxID=35768 RepID=A0ABZ2RR86_9BACT
MKLTKISNWIWVLISLLLLASVGIIITVFNYKIEKSVQISIISNNSKQISIIGSASYFHKLKIGDAISIKLYDQIYKAEIIGIKYLDQNIQMNVKNLVKNIFDVLRPSMSLRGSIIVDKTTIFRELFNSLY